MDAVLHYRTRRLEGTECCEFSCQASALRGLSECPTCLWASCCSAPGSCRTCRRRPASRPDAINHRRRRKCPPRSHKGNGRRIQAPSRSEEHTSELQSHSFISYAVFCLK